MIPRRKRRAPRPLSAYEIAARAVTHDLELSSGAKVLWFKYAQLAGDARTDTPEAGQVFLAYMLGVCDRTIRRWAKELHDRGHALKIKPRREWKAAVNGWRTLEYGRVRVVAAPQVQPDISVRPSLLRREQGPKTPPGDRAKATTATAEEVPERVASVPARLFPQPRPPGLSDSEWRARQRAAAERERRSRTPGNFLDRLQARMQPA
jgi:hypothetical protein